LQPFSLNFKRFFLVLVMLSTLVALPVTPAHAASLPAEINKQFTPLQIDAGGVSVLRVTIFNPNSFELTNASWTDNLVGVNDPGLFIADPANVVNTCGVPGDVTAVPGTTTLSLANGIVPAQSGSTPGECYVEVSVSSVTAGNLINTIPDGNLNAEGNDGGTPVVITNTSPASATITVIAVSSPSLSKSFNPSTIFVGESTQLTITINNNDVDTNLTGVSYTDTLPAGLSIASTFIPIVSNCGAGYTLNADPGTDTIALSGATVTPSQNCTVTVSVTGDSGLYTQTNGNPNMIPAGPGGTGSLRTDQGVTNGSPARADLSIQPVALAKDFSAGSIVAGGNTTLTITLQNPTSADIVGVNISDVVDNTLPGLEIVAGTEGTTCVTVGPPAHTLSVDTTTQTISLTNGTIPARTAPLPAVGTCTITVTVQAPLTISNTATTRTNTIPPGALTQSPPGVTNILHVSDTITVNPALTGTKSYSPTTVALNGISTVTIRLTNNSATDLTGVNFTDTLPANLTVSGTPAPSQCGGAITSTANSVTLAGGTIAANSNCTITFDVTSSVPGSGTTYENSIPAGDITTAQCDATQCVGNGSTIRTGTDLTVVNASQLPVTVGKSFATSPIQPGQTTRLRITITAPVDTGISGINITDNLPSGLIIATPNPPTIPAPSENCPGGTLTAVAGTGIISFSNLSTDTLNAGANCRIDVYVTSTIPGAYENRILANTVTTSQGRTNELGDTVATLQVTSMTVNKAFYPTIVQANGVSRMTITLQNNSPETLTDLTVIDNLPGTTANGLVVAPVPNATTTCAGGTVTANPGTQLIRLDGGTIPAQVGGIAGICTISIDVQGRDSSPTSASNYDNQIPVANVSARVPSTGTYINPTAQATARLSIQNLSIGVVKGFNPVLVYGGATSTMTVQLINPNSAATLTGIAFTDDMDLLYLPGESGIKLADPVDFDTGTCGGVLTGNPGEASFSFSGGVLAPSTSCQLTLKVVMEVNGNRTNRIPTGAVTTTNGVSSQYPTEASLTNLPGVSVSKLFNPDPVLINESSTLTITIKNTSNIAVVNMGLNDNLPGTLPSGLEVADPANVTNTCGGTLTANPGDQVISLSGGGLAGNATCVIAVSVTATVPGTYVNTIPSGALTADGGVTNNDPTTDSLTVTTDLFSLGNRVWFDTDNSSTINGAEVGADGVTVELYAADASGNPTGPVIGTQVTSSGGYYRFDGLPAGNYVVLIPASQFAAGGPLAGYWSSGTTLGGFGGISETAAPDPDNDADNDDNGMRQPSGAFSGAVTSRPVTLGPNSEEPIDDVDADPTNPAGESPNDRSNRTVDFGFYRQQLGNQIYQDTNENGTYDTGDLPMPGARVQLFASDGATEIPVGPDGILGTADDAQGGVTTGAGGTYLFSGLPEGSYVVKVLPTGYPSTVDTANPTDSSNPNTNADNNDNGTGTSGGTVSSNIVTLTPGNLGAGLNNAVDYATGTTYNPTVDFGYITSLGKTIVSTDVAHTSGYNVTIGEIVTYEVLMSVPVGLLNTVQLVDTPQTGLAFVDCVSITMPTNVTSSTFGSGGACDTSDGTTAGTSNPLIENSGARITFNFGDITNTTVASQIVTVRYSLIVLDILANQDGNSLTNNVTWTWAGGTRTTSAPVVEIIEPEMTIEKDATPSTTALGDTVIFTIDVTHSVPSTADAFDVVVTDQIPSGLTFVTGSLVYSGTATLTSSGYDPGTNTIRLVWDVFRLGETANLTFQAIFVGPAPVVNLANVEWTSLEIDPALPGPPPIPQQKSPYNSNSTERWYDPGVSSGVNNYGGSDSVTINSPDSTQVENLPETGFAPGKETILPEQPLDHAYATLGDLWLEIPDLGLKANIVGVPQTEGGWNVSWLWEQVGWLQGSAFPTWNGNSVVTGHVYLPNGKPGPFVDLSKLRFGNQVIVHAFGQRYIYEIRTNHTILPTNMSPFKHEGKAWLTLLTCKGYDESTDTYKYRVAVRAVLVKVEAER
jgi:LPXTG-site transpeptidase (sortase) family protein